MQDETLQGKESASNNEPVLQPERRKIPIFWYVVILVLACVGAYLAYQNRQLKTQIELLKNLSTQKTSSAAKTDPTADWQTYVNFGISIKYPNDLTITNASVYDSKWIQNPNVLYTFQMVNTQTRVVAYAFTSFKLIHKVHLLDFDIVYPLESLCKRCIFFEIS